MKFSVDQFNTHKIQTFTNTKKVNINNGQLIHKLTVNREKNSSYQAYQTL